ncbi:MAG: hypothetical protein OIF56_14210 [Cohaesibacter sp.]|nr:hypothetical protein [Cohaesibacter sp.]
MKKRSIILRSASLGLAIIGGYIGYSYAQTEHDIATYAQNVIAVADKYPSPEIPSHHLQKTHTAHLPEPVQAYFNYVFPKGAPSFKTVKFAMQGQSRRPWMETFEPTSVEQTIAVATPALVFSATTPIVPLIWAKAYDAYINGEMDMKARSIPWRCCPVVRCAGKQLMTKAPEPSFQPMARQPPWWQLFMPLVLSFLERHDHRHCFPIKAKLHSSPKNKAQPKRPRFSIITRLSENYAPSRARSI